MLICVTQINLKHLGKFFSFIPHAFKTMAQAQQAKGNQHATAKMGGWLKVCTLTAWDSEEAMYAYVRDGAHLKAMKASTKLSDFMISHHFEASEVPSWKEALARLHQEGQVYPQRQKSR